MVLLVLWVLGAEAGQVGLVAVQTPRVRAPPLGLIPVSIFHQEGDVGAEVELGLQERSGRAASEGAQDSQGPARGLERGPPGRDSDPDGPWLLSRTRRGLRCPSCPPPSQHLGWPAAASLWRGCKGTCLPSDGLTGGRHHGTAVAGARR